VTSSILVLTYHAIEPGPPPLFFDPALFEHHLDRIAESGVRTLALSQVAEEVRAGGPSEPGVAITFDDGFASVVENAAPLLVERGIPATVFCVAGHLGGSNDFKTDPPGTPRARLAAAAGLAELAAAGFELGSHGWRHIPLAVAERDPGLLRQEVVESRRALEDRCGCPVCWFAPPYGSPPGGQGRGLIERTYEGACGGRLGAVRPGGDRYALPRVDAHYVRRPRRLCKAIRGGSAYLRLRGLGARTRRIVRSDFVDAEL